MASCIAGSAVALCAGDVGALAVIGDAATDRTATGEMLDRLLSQSMTALIASEAVDVRCLAVDGMKMQSLASGRSFRSAGRLAELHRAAVQTVRKLRAEKNTMQQPSGASH